MLWRSILAVCLVVAGGLFLFDGLGRLWVLQPELPYWAAYMGNLSIVLGGLLLIAAGGMLAVQVLKRMAAR
jgi:hypothetical protein